MARCAIILAVLFSVSSFQSVVASPACAIKNRGLADCVAKCKDGWGRAGRLLGADPWGSVLPSGGRASQLDAVVALACGSSVTSTSTPTDTSTPPAGPINAAPLPTTTTTSTPVPVATTTSGSATTTSSTETTSSTATTSSSLTTELATLLFASSSSPPTPSSSSTPPPPPPSSSQPSVSSSVSSPPSTTRASTPPPAPTTTQAPPSTTQAPAPAPTTTSTRSTPPAPAPTTPSTPPSGSGGTSGADIAAYLGTHNSARRRHGAADLTWSDELAAAAQRWANNCEFKHSGGSVGPFGENLSGGTDMSPARAVEIWNEEVTKYNPSNPEASHFTQVVWKATTQVGCAVQRCPKLFDGSPGLFYVCEYSPQGNVIGRFAENVQV